MLKFKYLYVLLFVLYIVTGCASAQGSAEDEVINETDEYVTVGEEITEESTATHNALQGSINENGYDKDIVENSYLWSEPFPNWVDALDGENYTPLVDVISAEGIINATKLEIPESINGSKKEKILRHIDGDRCIVKLENNEVGIFYYFTGEYSKICSCDILDNEEADFYALGYDAGKLVLASSAAGNGVTRDAKLWLYDINGDKLKMIYTYNTRENSLSNLPVNKYCVMVEKGIYFSEGFVRESDDLVYGGILFYDYEKDIVKIDREFAVEPIKYGETYACFVGDDTSSNYMTLVDSDNNVLWEVDEYGRDIGSNGKDIFVTTIANDDEMMVTRRGFMTLDKKYIFTTYRNGAISDVTSRAMLPEIDCLNEEYVFFYDLELGKILRLDNIPKYKNFIFTNVSEDGRKMILEVNRFKECYLLEYR